MLDYKKSIGALIGNTMQFYDFTLYAFLAPEIKLAFFDFESKYLSYLIMFSVFSCGYLTRPLGALLFGYLADKKGRSRSLSITIVLATLSTFLIGLVPSYHTLGWLSPILLLILRLIQGFAVSGEEGSAVVLLFEGYAFKYQRLIGASVLSSVFLGLILGTIVCAISEHISSYQPLDIEYWRIPFLLALPLGAIATYLRYYLNDFRLFSLAEKNNLIAEKPLRLLVNKYWRTILFSFLIVGSYSVTTSTIIVHLPYYLSTNLKLSQNEILSIFTFALILMLFLSPLFAKFLEKFPVFTVYKWSTLMTLVFVPLIFYIFSFGNKFLIITSVLLFSILTSAITSTIFELLVKAFPFGTRCLGVSLSFNLSITVFSSSTPVVLLSMEHFFKPYYAPGLYISALLGFFLFAATLAQEKYQIISDRNKDEEFLYQTHPNNFIRKGIS